MLWFIANKNIVKMIDPKTSERNYGWKESWTTSFCTLCTENVCFAFVLSDDFLTNPPGDVIKKGENGPA